MEDFENQFEKKSKKKIGIIVTLAVTIALLIVATVLYFVVFNTPKAAFSKAVDKIFGSIEINDYDTVKSNIELTMDIESDEKEAKQISDILKDCCLNMELQLDLNQKQAIENLELNYKNENVIDSQIIYTNGDVYLFLNEIFDKYIQLNNETVDINQITGNYLNLNNGIKISEKNGTKAKKILANELKNVLNEVGKFSQETETIIINGKEKNVNKNVLSLNFKEMCNVISKVSRNLSENKKFIKLFDESPVQILNMVSATTSLVSQYYNYSKEIELNFEITIYTTGITNEIVGCAFEIYEKDKNNDVKMSVIKDEENTYSFTIVNPDNESITGNIKLSKETDKKDEKSGSMNLLINIPENLGTIKLGMKYKDEYGKEIDKINIKNSVKFDEITEKESQKITENLMELPLIGDVISEIASTQLLNKAKNNSTNLVDPTSDITEKSTKKNEVSNYEYKVSYIVPDGFEYDETWSSDTYKYYKKEKNNETIEANTYVDWSTEDEIKKYIQEDYEFETDYEDDVTLSNIKTIEINGKTYKYQVLSYVFLEEKTNKVYVWLELDKENYFRIDFEGTETEVSEDIIKSFLSNINISEI